MKKLTTALLITFLTSCTGRAGIPAIENKPAPLPNPPLQVWSITPSWIEILGDTIWLYGTGFDEKADVWIGSQLCTHVLVNSYKTVLRCDAPGMEDEGLYMVTVINPDGSRVPVELNPQNEEGDGEELDDDEQESNGSVFVRYVRK